MNVNQETQKILSTCVAMDGWLAPAELTLVLTATDISSIDDSLSVCADLLTDFFLCRGAADGVAAASAVVWFDEFSVAAGAGIVLLSLVTLIEGGTEMIKL